MDKRKVTIIGAGRTGRGMLGELFNAEGCFNIVFADNNSELVEGLRNQGWYTVEQKGLLNGSVKTSVIKGFKVVDTVRQYNEYIESMAESEFVATALFPDAFDQVAKDMAEAVKLRKARGVKTKAAFLLGANFVGLYDYYYPRIMDQLNSGEKEYFDTYISLVGTNANRKIVFPDSYNGDKYFLTGDDKPVLMVNNSFKFPLGYHYPSFFRLVDNLEMYMVEKIWTANLDHCSFGFMGNYFGYSTINQAVKDEYIRKCAYYAWMEARLAVKNEYGLPIPGIEMKRKEYRKYASPYFTDSIFRIGRDPIRKLGKNDRFIGPALLCLKHGIIPAFILKCASYGFFYHDENNKPAVKLQEYISEYGIEKTIINICGLDISIKYENAIYQMLLASYREISKEAPIFMEE